MIGLRDQGDDGDARVATDDCDLLVRRVGALDLGDKAGGTDNVKGGDTEEALGVVYVLGLEDFGDDWDSGVDLREIGVGLLSIFKRMNITPRSA